MSLEHTKARKLVERYRLKDGRSLFLLGEGRLINLAAAEGHPASVMDMSFANQALCLEYLVKNRDLEPAVYPVPARIDSNVASLKLEALGISIDTLIDEQYKYLHTWKEGT